MQILYVALACVAWFVLFKGKETYRYRTMDYSDFQALKDAESAYWAHFEANEPPMVKMVYKYHKDGPIASLPPGYSSPYKNTAADGALAARCKGKRGGVWSNIKRKCLGTTEYNRVHRPSP